MKTVLPVMGLVALMGATFGCRGRTTENEPVVPIRNMYDQPRYDPQERSQYFPDHRTMRPPVLRAVAREMEINPAIASGRLDDGSGWLLEIPSVVIDRNGGMGRLVERGQERFNIACSPCHGYSGHGDGLVARRAQRLGAVILDPPSFHRDAIRQMPDGQMYATVTHGVRAMPAYRHTVALDDRWAIVSYVRALQLSQVNQRREDQREASR